ncbi:MAG TPA: ATP-binding protein [Gemmatimonadaceae bacterium]|nr:ATP-binding protein [Gemmatimonadaceae bacterium]
MTDSAPSKRSLRTELVIQLTLLLTGALVLPTVLLVGPGALHAADRRLSLGLAIAGDVIMFAGVTWLILERVLVQPLRSLAGATDRASASQRLPVGAASHRELHEVGGAVQRMASRVIDDHADRLRAEKAASTSRLSATVARALGESVGVMLGNIHLLRQQLLRRAAPSQDLELLATLERESARLENLIRGLRDYARGRPVTMTQLDIEEIIRVVVRDLGTRGVLEGVDVTLELTGAPVPVLATGAELEQLFVTLLVNAADAMNGHGRIVVRLERAARFTLREPATRRDDTGSDAVEHPPSFRVQHWLASNDAAEIAKIIVADSGPGVPAALAERIFDPFFTTKPPAKGSGLGLAIASRTVENFRGAIWVTTAREGGAAFHLLFPIVPVVTSPRPRRQRLTPAASRRPAAR